jgi:hypothetical protein
MGGLFVINNLVWQRGMLQKAEFLGRCEAMSGIFVFLLPESGRHCYNPSALIERACK